MQPICAVICKAWVTRQGVRVKLGYKEKHVMSEAAGIGAGTTGSIRVGLIKGL